MPTPIEETNARLIATATAMLEGRMGLIEGVRQICSLRHDSENPNHEALLVIRGVDSETDHFPLGEHRQHYAADYLRRLDAEIQRYVDDARTDILRACREIVEALS